MVEGGATENECSQRGVVAMAKGWRTSIGGLFLTLQGEDDGRENDVEGWEVDGNATKNEP